MEKIASTISMNVLANHAFTATVRTVLDTSNVNATPDGEDSIVTSISMNVIRIRVTMEANVSIWKDGTNASIVHPEQKSQIVKIKQMNAKLTILNV